MLTVGTGRAQDNGETRTREAKVKCVVTAGMGRAGNRCVPSTVDFRTFHHALGGEQGWEWRGV